MNFIQRLKIVQSIRLLIFILGFNCILSAYGQCLEIISIDLIKEIPSDLYGINNLNVYFDGSKRLIAYGESSGNYDEGALKIYDFMNDQILKTIDLGGGPFKIKFIDDGKTLIYSHRGILYLLTDNFNNQQTLHYGNVNDFAVSVDNKKIFLYNSDNTSVEIYDLENGFNLIFSHTIGESISEPWENILGLSKNENLVAISGGYNTNFVIICNIATEEIKKILSSSTTGCYSPVFLNNDQQLATGGGYSSGVIDIIDIQSNTIIETIQAFNSYVYSLDIADDNTYLVSGGYDGIIKIFNIANWSEIVSSIYLGHINKVIFSNDMEYIISGNGAGSNAKVVVHKINYDTTTSSSSPSSTTTTIDRETTTTTIGICPSEQIYGEHSEEIELLRYFRYNVLSQTPEGREIIRLYYQLSPAIVRALEEDEEFKEDVKEFIDGVLPLIM